MTAAVGKEVLGKVGVGGDFCCARTVDVMTSEVRSDPLTGVRSVHPDMSAKPFPRAVRHLPAVPGACALCRLASEELNEKSQILDDGAWRDVSLDDEHVRTTSNRWSPVERAGRADLIVVKRHVNGIEELRRLELSSVLSQIYEVADRFHQGFAKTLRTISVGQSVGSSQPHLHAQVVSTSIESASAWEFDLSKEALAKDAEAAEAAGLVISREDALVYAPYAPSYAGELRIVAKDFPELVGGVERLFGAVATLIGPLDYRVVLHRGADLVAQVVLQFTTPGLHADVLGLTIIPVSPQRLAEQLR